MTLVSYMQIKLILKKHCIETEAKSQYERLVKKYFNNRKLNPDQTLLEDQIEGLKIFLEKTDFGYLRTTYPVMNGRHLSPVLIDISVNGNDIKIFHNKKQMQTNIK